jgi:hypothetical protein
VSRVSAGRRWRGSIISAAIRFVPAEPVAVDDRRMHSTRFGARGEEVERIGPIDIFHDGSHGV